MEEKKGLQKEKKKRKKETGETDYRRQSERDH